MDMFGTKLQVRQWCVSGASVVHQWCVSGGKIILPLERVAFNHDVHNPLNHDVHNPPQP